MAMASHKKPTAGIVLAAGRSTRFGRPKQLLPLLGRPLLEWVLDAALHSSLERIYLVLGYRHRQIQSTLGEKLSHPRIRVILNPRYPEGLSSSLRAGLLQARHRYPSVMFLLGDQPLVTSSLIDRLLEEFWGSDKEICAPCLGDRLGNPTLFSREHYPRLLSLRGDTGGRVLLRELPHQVHRVPVSDLRVFLDVDREEDLQALLDALGRHPP